MIHYDPWKVLWRKEKWAQKSLGGWGTHPGQGPVWEGGTKARILSPVVWQARRPIKTHLGRAVGGASFLISIVYLLSLFISRSLHYLQYMSIEILQFLWCKQEPHSGSLRKEASSEVFTEVKIELYTHRIIIHTAIWLNYLWNYRIWQYTNTGKHFLI